MSSLSMEVDSDDRVNAVSGPVTADMIGTTPAKSIEGWILLVRGVHEEADEDDFIDHFRDYGEVRNYHFNLDRRYGVPIGYTLIEYETKEEAENALKSLNGSEICGGTISVDWAFVEEPENRDR